MEPEGETPEIYNVGANLGRTKPGDLEGHAPDYRSPGKEYEHDSEYRGLRDFYRGTGKDSDQFRGIQPGSIWIGRKIYQVERDFGRGGRPYGWESYNGASTANGPGDLSNYRAMQPDTTKYRRWTRSTAGYDQTQAPRIKTQPPHHPSDGEIKKQIISRFYQLNELQADDIRVEVTKGVVTLNGFVHSRFEHMMAIDMARRTQGVRKVVNELFVL